MAFTVTSNSFKDGDYLAQGPYPVGGFRLRLRRRQQVAASGMVGRARRHQELRRHLLRSRRADRQRLLALAGGQHSAERDRAGTRRRQSKAARCRPAPCRRARNSARRATAAHARRRATIRIAICSRCSRSEMTGSHVNADTSAAVVGFKLHFNTLAKAAIMGLLQAVMRLPAGRQYGRDSPYGQNRNFQGPITRLLMPRNVSRRPPWPRFISTVHTAIC